MQNADTPSTIHATPRLLEGKHAVITGGSEGIGFGIAQAFVHAGASLILIGRSRQKLEAARHELMSTGQTSHDQPPRIHLLDADLQHPEQVQHVADAVLARWPHVDVLVNNAGIGRFAAFADTDEALFDQHFHLNVKAPYFLTQRLLPALISAQGNVINISSYFAHRMLPGRTTSAYSMTKGAVNAFTRALAFEVGHLGVRVNAIAPGSVETPQLQHNLQAMPVEGQQAFHNMVKTIYPLQRIGRIEDIGQAAVFLASATAGWITGTVLAVDGGLTTN